jgi:hypothetical protein
MLLEILVFSKLGHFKYFMSCVKYDGGIKVKDYLGFQLKL